MPYSGMLSRVALVRTDVLEELSVSINRVTRIGELGTTLALSSSVLRFLVTANGIPTSPILVTLVMEALRSSETRFLQQPHFFAACFGCYLRLTLFLVRRLLSP
jgi:hypothetical protein